MKASPYSSTALSAEGITFIATDYNPLWVMIFLHCEEEKENEHDKHAVAIIYDSFHLNNVAGNFLLYWNELANKYLKFPNYRIRAVVTVLLSKE